jgi:hypothetical protein
VKNKSQLQPHLQLEKNSVATPVATGKVSLVTNPIASEKQVLVASALATGEKLSCNPGCNRENYLSYDPMYK